VADQRSPRTSGFLANQRQQKVDRAVERLLSAPRRELRLTKLLRALEPSLRRSHLRWARL